MSTVVASKARGGVGATVPAEVTNFELSSDLHNQFVLLRLKDNLDGEFDFSFLPDGARQLGQRLLARADMIETAEEPSTQ
jgi:hypothetical protein